MQYLNPQQTTLFVNDSFDSSNEMHQAKAVVYNDVQNIISAHIFSIVDNAKSDYSCVSIVGYDEYLDITSMLEIKPIESWVEDYRDIETDIFEEAKLIRNQNKLKNLIIAFVDFSHPKEAKKYLVLDYKNYKDKDDWKNGMYEAIVV